ncbi:MAG: hypothetical protein A3E61_01845 [Candidatus Colwellbacteria bacterium RIFCSPHIGHO2_12_FULL_43_12]|uniref:LTD domain-containing protein n=1 Tax=Candidatus Colwellbacteria bacterium RIFCSPHIGHO2_12_FULL_43_12 TaxID=1797688 RepID=A0A1G1Z0S3_9BACT|nr:MAG: hypothetical protein A3E61_01845 [Candidatus Colwellbacteria bacterium RIFCSPHIGHO2_12_FULL_43_12]
MDFDNHRGGPVIEVIKFKQRAYWPKYAAILVAVVLSASGFYLVKNSQNNFAKAFRAAIVSTFKGTSSNSQPIEVIDVNARNNEEAETSITKPVVTVYAPGKNKVGTLEEATGVVPETAPLIVISEIMYDLPESDSGREWIEIRNVGNTSFEISKLSLYENKTNHKVKAIQGSINLAPNELAIIAESPDEFLKDNPTYKGVLFDSTFSLSNDGETIALRIADQEIDQVVYYRKNGASGDGESLQLINDAWTPSVPTPGS